MAIYLNQVGYLPDSKKYAVMTGSDSCRLLSESGDSTGVDLSISYYGYDEASGDTTWHVDFSGLSLPGTYYLEDAEGNRSPAVHIRPDCYRNLFRDLSRMFYFQRCGCALEAPYAGKFTHKACHCAEVRDYLAPEHRFFLNKGWHDAGDYGRYVTPGAVTLGHLLYAYELFPAAFEESLQIPESGSGIPDILSECRYELDWLLGMQLSDGGVAHKLTSQYHAPFLMPEDDSLPFFRYPVSSLATADFAACMALAYRIWHPFDGTYAQRLLEAAELAWGWLTAHPELVFEDPKDCHTGGYGDTNDADERLWACAELYRAKKDPQYLTAMQTLLPRCDELTALGWGDVAGFAGFSVLFADAGAFPETLVEPFRSAFLQKADALLSVTESSGYRMALKPDEFVWGSNLSVMSSASVLIAAALFTNDRAYADAAAEQLHYLLGRNPLGVSYVTGHGSAPFRNPHNRPTFADGIDEPIPGYVSGGPNGRPADERACALIPEGTPPMKCYADVYESYSTNEIAIYWNSIAVLAAAYFIGKS